MNALKTMKLSLILASIGLVFFFLNFIIVDEKQYTPTDEMTPIEKVDLFNSRPLLSKMFLMLSIVFGGSGLILATSRIGYEFSSIGA